ncbi:cbb3-type cytochrome oxidase subunit 3 [Parapusillimonas granuli]|uniref:CcoQ/FixQ family Cbb3-type cytochrome c oxidase assembly chaperone n=1 Tax=Parapusillimonas granuli TaxID=380911 RepID=A0A853G2V1_9BURK|nr:CcoQ/FixQ family Cbb3-type cytochrome c oxidase assembly chaperone [Parapusillimonas granuli]MBB5217064.1 cytochrome c oxidase cbb3-type subunit 4 [Parapusillimonas granuli]MEB2400606.1 CcoQ/FixQ family Cbb3-type cytochrome c oxidase assembly chaperone [Alcaligenaceae bacterium]NYT50172.1 CcoQ/FixQ family Cbb3-type cytochrome c oxidase assembly chaperone [Parapusillimonas granuli]
MAIINAIATVLAMLTFLGIVWWAFSRVRAQANHEASMLPFALPDEFMTEKKEGGSHE